MKRNVDLGFDLENRIPCSHSKDRQKLLCCDIWYSTARSEAKNLISETVNMRESERNMRKYWRQNMAFYSYSVWVITKGVSTSSTWCHETSSCCAQPTVCIRLCVLLVCAFTLAVEPLPVWTVPMRWHQVSGNTLLEWHQKWPYSRCVSSV